MPMNEMRSSRSDRPAWLWSLWLLLALSTPAVAQTSRPEPEGPPTRVEVAVHMIDFRSIDSAHQSFSANLFVLLQWRDPRLAHAGPGTTLKPRDSVWNPRPQIVNQELVRTSFPDVVEVSPDGDVTFRQRFVGSFSQPLNLTEFPIDRHNFEIELVFPGCSPDQVEVVPHEGLPSGLEPNSSLPDWEIMDWSTAISTHEPMPGVPGPCNFTFSIDARRHVGYYLFQVLLPLVLVLAMSYLVFWIDPSQFGTQISVSATSMLTLIAYRFMVGAHLPKVSYLTRLDVIVLGATLLVFATLCEAVITSGLASRGRPELARAIDRKARYVSPLIFLSILLWAVLG